MEPTTDPSESYDKMPDYEGLGDGLPSVQPDDDATYEEEGPPSGGTDEGFESGEKEPDPPDAAPSAADAELVLARWPSVVEITADLDQIDAKIKREQEAVENHKAKLVALRQEREQAFSELRDVIKDAKVGQPRLPFPPITITGDVPDNQGGIPIVTSTGEDTGLSLHPDDAWRETTLASIEGMPPQALAAMAAAGIESVGQFSDFQSGQPFGDLPSQPLGREVTLVKGIGSALAEKVEAAMVAYWAKQRKK